MSFSAEHAARFNRAQQLLKDKKAQPAIKLLLELLKEVPNAGPVHLMLGRIYARLKQSQPAEAHLRKATDIMLGNPEPLMALSSFYKQTRALGKARLVCEQASKIASHDLNILRELVRLQRATRDNGGALATLDTILELAPNDIQSACERAELLADSGKESEAVEIYGPLVKSGGAVPTRAMEQWARLMMRLDRTEEAVQLLEGLIKTNPDVFILHLLASSCYVYLGLSDQALSHLNEAGRIDPDSTKAMHDKGVVLRFLGRITESKEWFSRVLSKDPFNIPALRVYGTEHKYTYGDEPFNRLMRAVAHMSDFQIPLRVQMHYALGKAFDDLGDYQTAFEHFAQGGKLHLRYSKIDRGSDEVYLPVIRKHATAQALSDTKEKGFLSDKPIFILGMPRSGTSLVEQVLASHPDVYGAGELKYLSRTINGIRVGKVKLDLQHRNPVFPSKDTVPYEVRGKKYVEMLESFAKTDARKIVDKMPGNYMWVGMIHLILPNAPIIHTRRHPVETCLSAYRIFFPDGQYWSYDLKEMGISYRRYIDLMQHWRENLPENRLLEIRYEDMVNDLENNARQLIEYCGLEWNDACLNFHENDRPVRTASASQVRKPVYTTSIGRWRKYEPYLKPLLDELGPVVQQYEDELLG